MRKKFKSSTSRLAEFFELSRDKWKARSHKNQEEKRKLQNEVRDLRRSVAYWKNKYMVTESKKKPILNENMEQNQLPVSTAVRIKGHHYDASYVLISLSIYISANISLRGISCCFSTFQFYLGINLKTMSYGSIRQWILRLGYGLLQRMPVRRSDWIYIMDYSIELGPYRCLLILGVPQQTLLKQGYNLSHLQMHVLDIYITSSHKAKEVYDRLNYCIERTGIPIQIICDNGADVRKGAELLTEQYPQIIRSYDITHKIGTLIKKYLGKDTRWENLQKDLRSLSYQITQSNLSFLLPKSLGNKSKWLNIDKVVKSLTGIYRYEDKGDFHLIQVGYKIANHEQIANEIIGDRSENNLNRQMRKKIETTIFDTPQIPVEGYFKQVAQISDQIQWIDAGKQRFYQKFDLLEKHRSFITELDQLFNILQQIKTLIKIKGLSLETIEQIEILFESISYPWIGNLYQELNNFLIAEHAKIGADPRPMLLCSDIIESIFGKFKSKINHTVGGLYQSVLTIPLFCEQLNNQIVKTVMETTTFQAVNNWINQMQGLSNLAKRRRALNTS